MKRNLHLAFLALGWVGFFVLLVYSGMNSSWSSSYSAGVLTGYLTTVWFLDETIDRLAALISRRRSLHH